MDNEFKPYTVKTTKFGKDKILDIFIYTSIEEQCEYIDLFSALDELDNDDFVNLHIASGGGNLEASLLISQSLLSCKAPIVCYIDGEACSGASMIALCCDGWQLNPNSRIMCHTWTGGIGGKANEVRSQTEFELKWFDKRISEIYYPFLNKKEIKEMVNGHDFWFDADQISKRLDKVIAYRQKLAEQQEEECEDE